MKTDYPEAYRRGWQDFYGRKFKVTPDVLIPRPESEQIVDMALELAGKSSLPGVKAGPRKLSAKPLILDVGTGSGCLGISLKLELPEAQVLISDVSAAALEVAEWNARELQAEVELLEGDLLNFVSAGLSSATEAGKDKKGKKGKMELFNCKNESAGLSSAKFELIVANLPYVDKAWPWLKQPASQGLKYEPSLALYAEKGGLALIERLIAEANGRAEFLILEADPCQHTQVIDLAKAAHFELIQRKQFCLGFEWRGWQNK